MNLALGKPTQNFSKKVLKQKINWENHNPGAYATHKKNQSMAQDSMFSGNEANLSPQVHSTNLIDKSL